MSAAAPSAFSVLRTYVRDLVNFGGRSLPLILILMVFMGIAQGTGLLLILPLLESLGIESGTADGAGGGVAGRIGDVLDALGLPQGLGPVLGLYAAMVTLNAAGQRYREIETVRIVHGFSRHLRDRIHERLTRADWLTVSRLDSAEIMQVLTTSIDQVSLATQQSLTMAGTLVVAAAHVAVAFLVSPGLTVAALASALVLVVALRIYNLRAYRAGEALHGARTELMIEIREHLGGIKPAKAFGAEESHARSFRDSTARILDNIAKGVAASADTRMVYQVGGALILSGFVYSAARIARVEPAQLLVIAVIFARLLPKFSTLQQNYQRIFNALPAFRAAMELENRLAAAREPLPEADGAGRWVPNRGVSFRGVSFRYRPDAPEFALRDVDLDLPVRSMTGVMGPSGGGKSTLADLLMGLLKPERGEIRIDGEPLTPERVPAWRRSLAYVPQETFLFSASVRRNLLWAKPDASEADLRRALELAAASEFVSRLPQGLDTVLGERGVRISGGERQRIALARALLRDPAVLVLDEATSSVDTENERRIQDALERLRGGLTLVVIAHRLSTIRKADRIVVLESGRVAEWGSWEELHAGGGRFCELLRAGTGIGTGAGNDSAISPSNK